MPSEARSAVVPTTSATIASASTIQVLTVPPPRAPRPPGGTAPRRRAPRRRALRRSGGRPTRRSRSSREPMHRRSREPSGRPPSPIRRGAACSSSASPSSGRRAVTSTTRVARRAHARGPCRRTRCAPCRPSTLCSACAVSSATPRSTSRRWIRGCSIVFTVHSETRAARASRASPTGPPRRAARPARRRGSSGRRRRGRRARPPAARRRAGRRACRISVAGSSGSPCVCQRPTPSRRQRAPVATATCSKPYSRTSLGRRRRLSNATVTFGSFASCWRR